MVDTTQNLSWGWDCPWPDLTLHREAVGGVFVPRGALAASLNCWKMPCHVK